MISLSLVRQIEQLLAAGQHSHRQIAQLAGVCCTTIAAVAAGRPRDHDRCPPARGAATPGTMRRCPGCGGLAEMPCRLCQTRERLARHPLTAAAFLDEPLGLDLEPEHRARYAQVRMMRRREEKRRFIERPPANTPIT